MLYLLPAQKRNTDCFEDSKASLSYAITFGNAIRMYTLRACASCRRGLIFLFVYVLLDLDWLNQAGMHPGRGGGGGKRGSSR